jgi:hypothetical protein
MRASVSSDRYVLDHIRSEARWVWLDGWARYKP